MLKGLHTGLVRLLQLMLICFLGVLGCERKQTGVEVGVVYPMDALVLLELSEHWLDAAKNLALSSPEGSAAQPTLQYVESADCSLIYDFEVTTTAARKMSKGSKMSRNRPRTEQVLGRFEMRPEPETGESGKYPTMRLRGQQIGQYVVRNEIRLPGKESKAGEFPDVVLRNTGAALQAVENESVLWSGLHAFGGLDSFFPRLPVIETLEGEKELAVQAEPSLNVRVTEHLVINDQPAVVLIATGERFSGRYVVLNSGRVLHAAISRHVEETNEAMDKTQERIVRTQIAEARLTGACDGPVLSPIGERTSRVRNALDIYTRLVFAVHGDRADRVLSYLSQDLIDAHGVDPIVEMLKSHVARYGAGVLGDPSLIEPVEVEGDFLRFRVVGRAENSQADSDEVMTIVNHVVIEDGEAGMRVLSIASTTNQFALDSNMLEISPRRIFTAAVP